jgi:Sulfatase
MTDRPNVMYFQVDNLGFGELSCYSGGPSRGVMTERIDDFARMGFRLTNVCPESQCTLSRSALLTGPVLPNVAAMPELVVGDIGQRPGFWALDAAVARTREWIAAQPGERDTSS